MSIIKSGTTSTTAYQVEGNTNGDLVFQTNGTTTAMTIDTSQNVGIGTSSPASILHAQGTSAQFNLIAPTGNPSIRIGDSATSGTRKEFTITVDNTNNRVEMQAIQQGVGTRDIVINPAGGNLGIGTSSPVSRLSYSGTFDAPTAGRKPSLCGMGSYGGGIGFDDTNTAGIYVDNAAGNMKFFTGMTGATSAQDTTRMTLNSTGLGIGTTSPGQKLEVAGNILINTSGNPYMEIKTSGAGNNPYLRLTASSTYWDVAGIFSDSADPLQFAYGGSEKARITSGGEMLVGKTVTGIGTKGIRLNGPDGQVECTSNSGHCMAVNRLTTDGDLFYFDQDSNIEGSISVSGNTVSYNAFAGSHWSQLQDGSKPDILRGTVMESINELCVWPGEQNERLPKSKVSDTAGSKKVYGVFMAWDNDWTTTNDMYVTAVGAFICRVNGSVTVQEGDLLESNGDGTARVQADDIIRSSTIGKVTSTVKTHEYDDGSYCVPTVLYCG